MTSRPDRAAGRLALLAAILAVTLTASCRSVRSLPGQRVDAPLREDGRLDDFSKKITSHLFADGMMVGVGNDDRFLYVFFTPDIRHGQRPAGRARLLLWLDARGGKARRLGLEHVSAPPERTKSTPAGESAAPGEAPPQPDAAQPQELLKIIDIAGGKETYIALAGSQGPAVRLASDWGDFAYQLRLPLQATGDWPGLAVGPGQAVGIGIEWKIARLPAPGGDDRPGPRAGRGGSGMGGIPPRTDGGPDGRLPGAGIAGKRRFWLRTYLVAK